MSEVDGSQEERLKQLLKILDTFCSDSSTAAAELQQMANEAKRVVNKMQNFLERSLVEQVAELVQATQWDEVSEKIEQNFPGGLSIGKFEEILELVYLDGSLERVVSALDWAGELDVQLRSRAYEALYEHLKNKISTDQPQVLLLRKRVREWSEGRVSDNLRAQLDQDFHTIVGQIAKGVKKEDFSVQLKINEMRKTAEGCSTLKEVVPAVVAKFESFTLDNTLLLIQYSMKLPTPGIRCLLINALMKKLEARKLLSSEQSLQLWSHAKYTMEEEPNWKNVSKATQKLCTDVLAKLNMHKLQYFEHYQKYVEDQDHETVEQIHDKNWHLISIVSDFVTWYYKQEDLIRVQNLLSSTDAINRFEASRRILTQLQIEMHKFQQMNTFEAFCLFNAVKNHMALDNYKNQVPELKASFTQLKSMAPTCLRLLLWPDGNRLRLVNKFYDSPLSFRRMNIICSDASPELLFRASVDPDTALTTFSFKSGTKRYKLDSAALEDETRPWIGTEWRVKAVDDTHVKIFTEDGKFLVAGEPCQGNKSDRVACLIGENSTGMQLWKIEPVEKSK